MLEGKQHLRRIEPGPCLGKTNLVAQMEEKFSAIQKVCHKVKALSRLECVMQLDDKGVLYLLHDIPFNLGAFHLVRTNYEVFFQCFNGINLVIVFLLGHINLTE